MLTPGTKAPLTWVLDKIEGAGDFISGKAATVSGIRVVDDHTLVLKLEKPFGPFLSLLAMTTAYVVPREEVERLGQDFGTHPAGAAPMSSRNGSTVSTWSLKPGKITSTADRN